MSLIDQLDRKFRRFGIPALLRTVGLLQVIVYILLVVRPHAFDLLTLNPEAVKNGEIWRVFTFCLIPQTQSIIWMIFSVWMLFWVGDALESEWGPFRVTLYYFSTVALLAVAAWHGSPQNGAIGRMTDDGHLIILKTSSHYLYLSVFLAFCVTFPRRIMSAVDLQPGNPSGMARMAGRSVYRVRILRKSNNAPGDWLVHDPVSDAGRPGTVLRNETSQ